MGKKAQEVLKISYAELEEYLHIHHSVYMRVGSKVYYITDANENYWRAQDTSILLSLRFVNGHTIEEVFDQAYFYASISGQKD